MSHFVRCDRCNVEDAVMGTVTLPPGWQKICGVDLCEPCCMLVRDFIRFKPSDAAALPVEPIPAEAQPAPEPSKDGTRLFETKPTPPNVITKIAESVAAEVNAGALDTTTCKVSMTVNPADEQNADERARTRKQKRAHIPKPEDPQQPGAQA